MTEFFVRYRIPGPSFPPPMDRYASVLARNEQELFLAAAKAGWDVRGYVAYSEIQWHSSPAKEAIA